MILLPHRSDDAILQSKQVLDECPSDAMPRPRCDRIVLLELSRSFSGLMAGGLATAAAFALTDASGGFAFSGRCSLLVVLLFVSASGSSVQRRFM